jgi:hypothetical protein
VDGMLQRAPADVEPFTHGVESAAQTFAITPMCEHEPCGPDQTPWQRVPPIEVRLRMSRLP